MSAISLDYGAAEPLLIEAGPGATVADCRAPDGVSGDDARRLVAAALAAPPAGPPLDAHVVAGDRVVVAIAGAVPQPAEVVAAVAERLEAAGVAAADIGVLIAPPLEQAAGAPPPALPEVAGLTAEIFDPARESATAYLAADEAGRPLYLARRLVDADVVVAVGRWGWNPALGGRSLEGESWPSFSRRGCRQDLEVALARRGRHALPEWKSSVHEVAWQLGICASLRLVAGVRRSLHAACFGLPDEAGRRARAAAAAWCPRVAAADADLAVASLSEPHGGFAAVTRAIAAASRVTAPGGTICVACRVATGPGIIFERWRQGAPLERLVHEAVSLADPALVADAVGTRLCARALADRRLVLLSDIGEGTVEELGFGFAASPEAVERLAHRADRLVVLHEADQMLPQIAG